MKRIYTYLSVKCNIHVHVEINFKHLNTYVQGDICCHTELLSFYICTMLQ
jgi:ribosomal protein S27E